MHETLNAENLMKSSQVKQDHLIKWGDVSMYNETRDIALRFFWQKEQQVLDVSSKPGVSTYTMASRHHVPKTNAHSCL
jgi:hypothetical protein